MKAEEIKKSEEFLNAYLGGNRNISTLTWDHWVECLQDYADTYARIQIEKHNERIKAKYPPCPEYSKTVDSLSTSFRNTIDNTPHHLRLNATNPITHRPVIHYLDYLFCAGSWGICWEIDN
jgi:hypothetical protein